MVDKQKKYASRLGKKVTRGAPPSDASSSVVSTSDQSAGDAGDTGGDQRPGQGARDLDVLERRVLGAVRGAVKDVLIESNQHPELPYIDMNFAATDTKAKKSSPVTTGAFMGQSQNSDRPEITIIPSDEQKVQAISLIKLGSTIMAGLITGLVMGVAFGIVPQPFGNFSDPVIMEGDNRIEHVVGGLENNSQPKAPHTDYTVPPTEPPKPKRVQRSDLVQTDRQNTVPAVKPAPQKDMAELSVVLESEPLRNVNMDENRKSEPTVSNFSNENKRNAQVVTSLATEIKEPLVANTVAKENSSPAFNLSAPIGQVIVLRIKGGTIEVTGRLKEYGVEEYVVVLENSRIMALRADLYDCVSDNCTKTAN